MKITFKKISWTLLGGCLLTIYGCGGGGGSSPATTPVAGALCAPGVTQSFTGDIETTAANAGVDGGTGGGGDGGGAAGGGGLGKVLGGKFTVTDLSDGTVVGSANSDSVNGLVTVRTCSRTGPFLLSMEGQAGATYYDEGLNQMTPFAAGNALHALVDKWDEHVGVSALTEAAYRYALNNYILNPANIAKGTVALASSGSLVGLTAAQVVTANNLIATAVNGQTTSLYQLISAKALPTPVDASSTSAALLANSRYGLSAAVNGGLVKAASYYNPATTAPALAFANDLARDFTDGKIDGFALDRTPVAPATQVSYESTRMPLVTQAGISSMANKFAASTIQSSTLRVDQISSMSTEGWDIASGPTAKACSTFRDHAALMSNGSVWVNRQHPTNINGVCSYTDSVAEHANDVLTKDFLTDVRFLFGNSFGIYAVKKSGALYGWGGNFCGSISLDIANATYSTPQLIPNISNVTSISQDLFATMMRDSNGNLYVWELEFQSNPGTNKSCGTIAGFQVYQRNTAVQYTISNFNQIATYNDAFFAVGSDGSLWGWGSGTYGLLANSGGTLNSSGTLQGASIASPQAIPGISGVRKIVFTGQDTVLALLNDGTVKAWGSDTEKLLGFGQQKLTPVPTTVAGLSNISNIVANSDSVRLTKTDGTALIWNGVGAYPVSGPNYSTPTVVKATGPIRYMDNIGGGYTFYFQSGAIGVDINDIGDLSIPFH